VAGGGAANTQQGRENHMEQQGNQCRERLMLAASAGG